MDKIAALDKLDKAILRRLQVNGRETYDVIGDKVSLSASAVLRRIKRLEEAGVIDSYVALVRPESVGLGLTAYINVRLEKHTESHKCNPMDVFRASVQTWPEVVECAALTGDMDYLLRVVVQDGSSVGAAGFAAGAGGAGVFGHCRRGGKKRGRDGGAAQGRRR